MTDFLYCDTETFSPLPLKIGTHAYAEQAEVLLFSWAFNDEPPELWDLTVDARMPAKLRQYLGNPDVVTVWHNGGMFDRTVCKHALPEVFNLVPLERWYDTMVQAYAHGLPGSLDLLCEILNLPQEDRKLKTGKVLINLFCKPPAKNLRRGRATRWTHPVEWEQFKTYALADIPSMRSVHRKLPTWNYQGREFSLWCLDQRINQRGVPVDIELAHSAVRAVARTQARLADRTVELTAGAVQRASQRDKLLAHLLVEYGIELPDLQKSTLERRIDDQSLPWALRELLAIRLQASSTSTSKYQTLIKGVSSDGRLRGTLQFCGASRTGRWAGRLFQPQNLPRPTLEQDVIDAGIEALKADCEDLVVDNVMELTSSAIRGCIIAPPDRKLVVADLSNIEGRVLAWLAGEDWKLKAFSEFDTCRGVDGKWHTGTALCHAALTGRPIMLERDAKGDPIRRGHDLYKLAYARAFNISPEEVDKHMRQIGKVLELALGYEGGVGAFITFALVYGLDLDSLADAAYESLPADLKEEAIDFHAWTIRKRRTTFGLEERVFVTCDTFKRAWRQAHPETQSLWRELQDTVVRAARYPNTTFECRRLKIRRERAWLQVRLPSGRRLCYPAPRVDDTGKFSYMGVNQYSRKWGRIKSYGGKLVENVTQGVARDVIGHGMPAVEEAGYDILLTVHDEDITEAPDLPEFNAAHLSAIISTNPEWAPGLPLAAAGFEAYRYRKD